MCVTFAYLLYRAGTYSTSHTSQERNDEEEDLISHIFCIKSIKHNRMVLRMQQNQRKNIYSTHFIFGCCQCMSLPVTKLSVSGLLLVCCNKTRGGSLNSFLHHSHIRMCDKVFTQMEHFRYKPRGR